ncbi:MAG: twin-arginine translocase subunit TatB [Polyangiaceae bacterium]|nr:twin-arginine translocase subunit TatB [Polyangiaceae bacterium]
MFGVSFIELMVIGLVALIVVGPHKLPSMLRSIGEWMRRLRNLTTEVRAQTGIDEILREEGLTGGLAELRSMLRGDLAAIGRSMERPGPENAFDPYAPSVPFDPHREYPSEGVDAAGVVPEDLLDEPPELARNHRR